VLSDLLTCNVNVSVLWVSKYIFLCTESCRKPTFFISLSFNDYNNNNNNITNTNDNVYGAVIVTQSLREFTWFIWRMQTSASARRGRRPSDQANRPRLLYGLHTSSPFIINQLEYTHFTVPRRVEGWVNLGTQHAALYNIMMAEVLTRTVSRRFSICHITVINGASSQALPRHWPVLSICTMLVHLGNCKSV